MKIPLIVAIIRGRGMAREVSWNIQSGFTWSVFIPFFFLKSFFSLYRDLQFCQFFLYISLYVFLCRQWKKLYIICFWFVLCALSFVILITGWGISYKTICRLPAPSLPPNLAKLIFGPKKCGNVLKRMQIQLSYFFYIWLSNNILI